jgi:hypothetical protein
MKMHRLTMRLLVTSLALGCIISTVLTAFVALTRVAFYFPPFWPGLFFSWIVIIVSHGELWSDRVGLSLVAIGNAVFYAWIFFRLVKAEVVSRGPLGRFFCGSCRKTVDGWQTPGRNV